MGLLNTNDDIYTAFGILIGLVIAFIIVGILMSWIVSFCATAFVGFIIIPEWLLPILYWLWDKKVKRRTK